MTGKASPSLKRSASSTDATEGNVDIKHILPVNLYHNSAIIILASTLGSTSLISRAMKRSLG